MAKHIQSRKRICWFCIEFNLWMIFSFFFSIVCWSDAVNFMNDTLKPFPIVHIGFYFVMGIHRSKINENVFIFVFSSYSIAIITLGYTQHSLDIEFIHLFSSKFHGIENIRYFFSIEAKFNDRVRQLDDACGNFYDLLQ